MSPTLTPGPDEPGAIFPGLRGGRRAAGGRRSREPGPVRPAMERTRCHPTAPPPRGSRWLGSLAAERSPSGRLAVWARGRPGAGAAGAVPAGVPWWCGRGGGEAFSPVRPGPGIRWPYGRQQRTRAARPACRGLPGLPAAGRVAGGGGPDETGRVRRLDVLGAAGARVRSGRRPAGDHRAGSRRARRQPHRPDVHRGPLRRRALPGDV